MANEYLPETLSPFWDGGGTMAKKKRQGDPDGVAELLASLPRQKMTELDPATGRPIGDERGRFLTQPGVPSALPVPEEPIEARVHALAGRLGERQDYLDALYSNMRPEPEEPYDPATDYEGVPALQRASGPAPMDPAMRYAAGENQALGPALASRTMAASGPAPDAQKAALQEALKRALREGSPATR